MPYETKRIKRNGVVSEIFEKETNKNAKNFDSYVAEFADPKNFENRKNLKDVVVKLLIAVLFETGEEDVILQKYLDKNRICLEKFFKGDKKHIPLFINYFIQKLIDAVYKGFLNNIDIIKNVYQEEVEGIIKDLYPFFSENEFVAIFKNKGKVKNSSFIMPEKLTRLSKINQKLKAELIVGFKEQYKKRIETYRFLWLPRKMWVAIFQIPFYYTFLTFWQDIVSNNLEENILSNLQRVVGCAILYFGFRFSNYIIKKFVQSRIKKDLTTQLNENLEINWEKKAELAVVIKTKNRVVPSIELTPPTPRSGMSSHAYLRQQGINPASFAASSEDELTDDSPEEEKPLLPPDPNNLGKGRKGVFNVGAFTLAKLGVPDEQWYQFIEGYNRGWKSGYSERHTHGPGIWPLKPEKAKGWTAEIIPLGGLEGRILATTTQEADGTKTLHFRHFQSVHDVRKWLIAPPPLPAAAMTIDNRVGLGL